MITVLMPVYNGEKYLASAIESILMQTYQHFEFIIINDGSTDKTREIIYSYTDKRIIRIENEINMGLIFSLNKGIDYAKGEYIARMDADDISLSQRLEKQIKFFELDTDLALLGTQGIYIDEEGNENDRIEVPLFHNQILSQLFFGNAIIHSSVMVKKNVLKGTKYNPDFYLGEDYFLWSRLALKNKVVNSPEVLVKHRIHGGNISFQKWEDQVNCVRKVYRFHLSNIGLNNMSDEIESLHYNILNFKLDSRAILFSELKKIRKWLNTLITQNKTVGVYDHKIFHDELKLRWNYCFAFQSAFRFGIKAIPYAFVFFSLSDSLKVKIRFIINCLKSQLILPNA